MRTHGCTSVIDYSSTQLALSEDSIIGQTIAGFGERREGKRQTIFSGSS